MKIPLIVRVEYYTAIILLAAFFFGGTASGLIYVGRIVNTTVEIQFFIFALACSFAAILAKNAVDVVQEQERAPTKSVQKEREEDKWRRCLRNGGGY